MENKLDEVSGFKKHSHAGKITWINIDGLNETEVLEDLGKCFGLHPLVLEDMLNTEQRPKIEDYDDYIYIVVKMLYFDSGTREIVTEHQSIVFGRDFVISVGEREGDVFEPVRDRLRSEKSRIRKQGADYLAYSLLDAIIDNYFVVLEKLGDSIEAVEELLVSRPSQNELHFINDLKRDMLYMHKYVWPLREVASLLERGESTLVADSTRFYLRDVYDHVIQVMDTTETYRDLLSGMLDIYLSSISNRMNEIMKVLTIISTIFIPLTFLAGIYGMNFKLMPELEWKPGYPVLLIVMSLIAAGMLYFFRRKKWL
jgi:magnesium transporter